MQLEEIANTWSPQLYSLLHLMNLTFFLPKLHYEGTGQDNHSPDGLASFGVFTIWAILYFAYKKLLNLMLRRMRFPLMQRNRIVDGLWCCGFSACSIAFLLYFVPENRDYGCPWRKAGNVRLGFFIHKAFYLHRATIEVFVHRCWLRGWTSQLFASSVPIPSQQKWPEALTMLLFYKASDIALLNICKILLTLSRNKIVKRIAKLLFLLHFFNWIYVHILLVPGSLILHNDVNRDWRTQASLWMWLVCELVNSIRNKEFRCMYSTQSLETSLFPPPSQEAIEFVNIIKKHRSAVNEAKIAGEASAHKQKTELWQTIFCAMTMKKKLKKLREAKRPADDENSE